jgi:hypothetical protein
MVQGLLFGWVDLESGFDLKLRVAEVSSSGAEEETGGESISMLVRSRRVVDRVACFRSLGGDNSVALGQHTNSRYTMTSYIPRNVTR